MASWRTCRLLAGFPPGAGPAGRARCSLPWGERGRGGSWLLECVFHRAFAPGGPAPHLGLLECRVAHLGAQCGQDRIVVRDARHEGVQPAASPGVQDRAGGSEQAYGTLRVVLLSGDARQDLEIVGGAGFVAGLGRQRQPLLQVSRCAGQVALGLPGQRQVVQRNEQGEPVLGTDGPRPGRR